MHAYKEYWPVICNCVGFHILLLVVILFSKKQERLLGLGKISFNSGKSCCKFLHVAHCRVFKQSCLVIHFSIIQNEIRQFLPGCMLLNKNEACSICYHMNMLYHIYVLGYDTGLTQNHQFEKNFSKSIIYQHIFISTSQTKIT